MHLIPGVPYEALSTASSLGIAKPRSSHAARTWLTARIHVHRISLSSDHHHRYSAHSQDVDAERPWLPRSASQFSAPLFLAESVGECAPHHTRSYGTAA